MGVKNLHRMSLHLAYFLLEFLQRLTHITPWQVEAYKVVKFYLLRSLSGEGNK